MNVFYTNKAKAVLDAKMAELRGKGAQTTARAIADAIERGNERDRLAGKDRYGKALKPLKGPRKGRYAGATGPPLAPFGARSRSVSAFRADPSRAGGNWRIKAGWVGAMFLAFHAYGAGRLPIRDLFGISPTTWAEVRKIVDSWKAKIARIRA